MPCAAWRCAEGWPSVRLVHLAHWPVAYPGSFVPMLRAALGAARARGWEAEAVFGTDSRGCEWLTELEEIGVMVRFVELDGRLTLGRELRAMLSESAAPTILHTHFTRFDVPAALAAARRPSAAVVWHLHSPARTDPAGRLRGVMRSGLVGRLVDRILCVAPDRAAAAVREGAPRARVLFFPNAIDTASFAPAGEPERRQARTSLGLDPARVVLLHFGWDWRRKGGDVFLRAVRELLDRGRTVTALTLGAGAEAEQLAAELGLGAAFVSRPFGERVQTVYAAANVLASPSRAEGMPFAMLEALASGVPVAASAIPGQTAIAEHLAACRLTELTPHALAAGIASLLDRDADTASSDADAALRHVRETYDLVPWAARMLDVYDELFEAAASSR